MSLSCRCFLRRFAAVCVLALICVLPASAERLADTLYVAGNENLYPLEYYANGRYQGAFPALLEQLSAETGLRFVYLPRQNGVTQRERADNCQAEIISCLVRTEDWAEADGVSFTAALYTVPLGDGGTAEVCFGLTGLLPEDQAQRFLAALEHHTAAAPTPLQAEELRRPLPAEAVLGLVLILGMAGALLLRRSLGRRGEQQEMHIVDEELLCENLDGIEPIARPLWYLALYQLEGTDGLVPLLSSWMDSGCMPAILKEDEAALLFTVPDEEQAVTLAWGTARDLHAQSAALLALRDNELGASVLLACARRACVLAQRRGEPLMVCTGPVMKELAQHEMLRCQLRAALESNQFELYIQPIVRASDGVPMGAEALSRWDHPTLGFLTPYRFVELVQELELEMEFDQYQLRKVCRELARWHRAGREELFLHCNVSRRTISMPEFADWMKDLLEECGLPPRALTLEMTEEHFEDQAQILRNLGVLHRLGIRLALDDYGTGATCEDDLRLHLFHVVKLDVSLLRGAKEAEGLQRLRDSLAMIHAGGAKAVCEGVETAEEAALMRELGCDLIQGFYYYRPMPQRVARRLLLHESQP